MDEFRQWIAEMTAKIHDMNLVWINETWFVFLLSKTVQCAHVMVEKKYTTEGEKKLGEKWKEGGKKREKIAKRLTILK